MLLQFKSRCQDRTPPQPRLLVKFCCQTQGCGIVHMRPADSQMYLCNVFVYFPFALYCFAKLKVVGLWIWICEPTCGGLTWWHNSHYLYYLYMTYMYTICIRILRKLKVVGLCIWSQQLGGLTWWHYSQAPETNKPPIFSFDHNSMFIS